MDEWGTYFNAKKAKLQDQLHTQSPKGTRSYKQIFEGISIYINGYTNPPEPELREIFIQHGGKYSQYFSAKTMFVIATTLPMAKKRLMSKKALRPEWITESIHAGVKLDYRKYFLYNSNAEEQQTTLTQLEPTRLHTEANGSGNRLNLCFASESPQLDSTVPLSKDYNHPPDCNSQTATSGHTEQSNTSLKSTTEEGFLDDFYNNSRLHLISTMKKHTQQLVAGWRRDSANHEFKLLADYKAVHELHHSQIENQLQENRKEILHVDLDCFFVAVGRLTRPHLVDVPVAVTHSKGTKVGSKAEIACVSYEGRAKGVSAGMWLDEAKNLCPELQTIPYEFEEYKRISTIFFKTIASLTLDIEPISCDELYLNGTKVLAESGTSPAQLAQFLRDAIKDAAKIVCSIGIGNSKLCARIATRQAKENRTGICTLTEFDFKLQLLTLPVEKLPGVGYSTAEKLHELYKVHTCGDLQQITLAELKQKFGDKTGDKLFSLARGIDNDPVQTDNTAHLAKSVSAGCAFGVRFKTFVEVNAFIKQISNEVSKRAGESKCFGKKITLSLWIVKKGHINEPVKPGAHGVVDVHSRTRPFHVLTRDSTIISKMSSELMRSVTTTSISANYIRGVRISLDNLRYEDEMTANERKTVQRTIECSFEDKSRSVSNVTGESTTLSPKFDLNEFAGAADSNSTKVKGIASENPQDASGESKDSMLYSSTSVNSRRLELPFLNGVNKLQDVKCLLEGGINTKQFPGHGDVAALTSYLKEILETNRVEEGSQIITYLWELISSLRNQENELSLRWSSTFLRVLRALEGIIYRTYGDTLRF